MKNDFNMCPMCGSKKIENHDNIKWVCPDCGFDLYCNVASAVGVIIYDDENNVLFEVRAKEPSKGKIVIPGGFIDFDERAEDAIVRECREEIGVEVVGEGKIKVSIENDEDDYEKQSVHTSGALKELIELFHDLYPDTLNTVYHVYHYFD